MSRLGEVLDLDLSVRLWDGSLVPLGRNVESPFEIVLSEAGILSSLIRRPTPENLVLHYAKGNLAIEGGSPEAFLETVRRRGRRRRLRRAAKWRLVGPALRAAMARPRHARSARRSRRKGEAIDPIRFHYDVGNAFYALFLDREMQYSCAFFRDSDMDLDRAQAAKLDLVCRELDLRPDERFLDVGCGWGGLLCHAARRYGVRAHGITLSPEQLEFTQRRIESLGLEESVTVELRAVEDLDGTWDKIASIEMIEHVGLANYPGYFRRLRACLAEGGRLLNQGTTRRSKRRDRRRRRPRLGSRLIGHHVFPGFELSDLGHTVAEMETAGFELLGVRGWREHYARTTAHWCRRLWERREEAFDLVGPEKVRIWLAYLAGVSVAFREDSLRVHQILARHGRSGSFVRPDGRDRSRAAAASRSGGPGGKDGEGGSCVD
ncbi:MAG TPA: class I SAM-dependent methyltransferase [Deltaproteobacteria bacterium]|nr:class I SAM-dependent methyltransferase [Deltaproteobacteria bacterium]